MKIKFLFLFLAVIALMSSAQSLKDSDPSKIKKGMIKISIIYANGEGNTFDMDYYANKHMPMVAELFGPALKHLAIDKGLSGRTPNDKMPFLAVGYFYFDTLEEYDNAFLPNAEKILSDIPNYTNIQPVVQISEVVQ